ncbi:hypothetical protein D9M71_323280 [compost metagenome]
MAHLSPVGSDHVGRSGQPGGAAKLGHHLAARVTVLGATGVFGVGQHIVLVAAQGDGLLQRPRAIGVERDARFGEAFGQRCHGLHLFFTTQHAALELEVAEAIARLGGLGQPHHCFRGQGLFMAQAEPVVLAVGFVAVGQVGLLAVADVEQVTEHLHRIALLPLAQQCRHRHVQVLAEQVEQRRLDGRHRMHGNAQVEGLQATASRVAVGEGLAHGIEHALVVADRLADHQAAGIFQGLADLLAAGHLAQAGITGAVTQYHDVAGEVRAMGATEVEQHAVVAGHRDHAQVGDHGGAGMNGGSCLHVHGCCLAVISGSGPGPTGP